MLLAYDELKALVDKFHVQGSALLSMVTSLYESDCWENRTKKMAHSMRVESAQLSLIGCATRDTYADMWGKEAIATGLPNRLFVVNADGKGKVAWPAPPDQDKLEELRRQIEAQLKRLPLTLDIVPDAKT